MKKTLLALAVCALPVLAFAAQPKVSSGMLVDAHSGKTLYTFDKDTEAGKSACAGDCMKAWPAAMASSSDKAHGDWGIMHTADGKRQWTYKGHPLYTFVKDMKSGDMNGDNVKNVWHMATP